MKRFAFGDSDQGYFCKGKNVLTDVEKVLRITKVFYETGSYEALRLMGESMFELCLRRSVH